MAVVLRVKRRLNGYFPYYRRCMRGWCLRGQTYNHRCYLHNRSVRADKRLYRV